MTEEQIANLKHFEQSEFLKDARYRLLSLMGHDIVCGVLQHRQEFGMDFVEVFTPTVDGGLAFQAAYAHGALFSIREATRTQAAAYNIFRGAEMLYVVCRHTGEVVREGHYPDCLVFEEMEKAYGPTWDENYWVLTERPGWVEPIAARPSPPVEDYDPFCEGL